MFYYCNSFINRHGTTPALNQRTESEIKPMAVVTSQTVDEGGRCQRAVKHLTPEETGKGCLSLCDVCDKHYLSIVSVPLSGELGPNW